MKTFSDIISLWPSAEDFARDVGVPGVTARQWRNRDSIPAARWNDVVKAATARGLPGVSVQAMADIAAAPADVSDRAAS